MINISNFNINFNFNFQKDIAARLSLKAFNTDIAACLNNALNEPGIRIKQAINQPFLFRSEVRSEDTPVPPPSEVYTEKKSDDLPKESKMKQRKKLILKTITQLGYDPLNPPMRESGKCGIKREVREFLKKAPLFQGKRDFDKAWSALSSEGKIVDKTKEKGGTTRINSGKNSIQYR